MYHCSFLDVGDFYKEDIPIGSFCQAETASDPDTTISVCIQTENASRIRSGIGRQLRSSDSPLAEALDSVACIADKPDTSIRSRGHCQSLIWDQTFSAGVR